MTPKEEYEARKAERLKLRDLEYQTRTRTEALMMLDTLDRFVMAVERIADAMTSPKLPTADGVPSPVYQNGCVCPVGAELGCGSVGCPRRSFRGLTSTC